MRLGNVLANYEDYIASINIGYHTGGILYPHLSTVLPDNFLLPIIELFRIIRAHTQLFLHRYPVGGKGQVKE